MAVAEESIVLEATTTVITSGVLVEVARIHFAVQNHRLAVSGHLLLPLTPGTGLVSVQALVAHQLRLLGDVNGIAVLLRAGQAIVVLADSGLIDQATHLYVSAHQLCVKARFHISRQNLRLALDHRWTPIHHAISSFALVTAQRGLLDQSLLVAVALGADCALLGILCANSALLGIIGHASAVEVILVLVNVALVLEVKVVTGTLEALEHLLVVGAAELGVRALIASDAVGGH